MKSGIDGKSLLLGALLGAVVASSIWTVGALIIFGRRPAAAITNVATKKGTVAEIPSVEGTWFNAGDHRYVCVFVSTPTGLCVTNEQGGGSRIIQDSAGFIIAADWDGGMRGDVSEDKIRWANGAVWSRTPKR